uniref:Fanconi Anaemia group E protein C-terminal domain-containing protein n=3 Tax=Rhodnius TaxID=13248 RepID=T1IBW7_RHOPR
MFSSVLLAEEVMSPLSTNEDNINPNELFSKIVRTLLKDEKLKAVLNVRKGKTLVLRVLPHTSVSGPLAHKLITVLPSAAKKDPDQALLRALPAIRQFLASVSMRTLVELAETLQPHISFLLPNKFGISVIANMIERAECLITSSNEQPKDWMTFITTILSNCQTCEIERPVVGLPGQLLATHLARCKSANNQDIVILQKTLSHLNMFDK